MTSERDEQAIDVTQSTAGSDAGASPEETPAAAAAPATPRETSADAESNTESPTAGAAQGELKGAVERAKRRILIGSERPAKDMRAKAQHRPLSVPRADDESQAAPQPPTPQPAAGSDRPTSDTAVEGTAVENAIVESAGPATIAGSATVPIPVDVDAVDVATEELRALLPAPGKRAQVPSRRAPLSQDLEKELEEALGDMSLDDIIASESATGENVQAGATLDRETSYTGTVLSLGAEDVFVEVGKRQQGIVPLSQFEEPPAVGAQFEFVVTGYLQEDDLYQLGLPGAATEVADWSDVQEGVVVEATISGHNKGGLESKINNIRGFIPVSQIALYRVEDLAEFVGQKFACVITEANPEKKNLVLSRRAILEREKVAAKERFLAEVAPGKMYDGTVRKLMDFGAFVELGDGVDGLVHVSKMTWGRVDHPSEVVKEGDQVKVRVDKVDPETGKISLSMKDQADDPWKRAPQEFYVGAKAEGKVSKIMQFGAFVELLPGVEGLIHISELSHGRTFRVSDVVSEGQQLEVQVLSIDPDARRIGLSLKALMAAPVKEEKSDQPAEIDDTEHTEQLDSLRKQRKKALKGGTKRSKGGQQFGLKW